MSMKANLFLFSSCFFWPLASANASEVVEKLSSFEQNLVLNSFEENRLQLPNSQLKSLEAHLLNDQGDFSQSESEFRARLSQGQSFKKLRQVFPKEELKKLSSLPFAFRLLGGLVGSFFLGLMLFRFLPHRLRNKPKIRKIRKKIQYELEDLPLRFFALVFYLFPFCQCCINIWRLVKNFPFLAHLLPGFVVSFGHWLSFWPLMSYINYIYFFGSFLVVLQGWPSIRFLRFQWLRGLMLVALAWNADYFLSLVGLTHLFGLWVCFFYCVFILGAMVDAFRLVYPSNKTLRDALEMNLGYESRHGRSGGWWEDEK